MSKSWAQLHTVLSPLAVNVLTAMTVLGVVDVDPADLAVAVGADEPDVHVAIDELRNAGWLAARPAGGEVLLEGARTWLTFDAPERPAPAVAAAIASRYLAAQSAALEHAVRAADGGRWVSAHRTALLTAIGAGVRTGLHTESATITTALWPLAGELPDPTWWRELARLGEEAAVQAGDLRALIELHNASAAVFDAAGDHPTAEQQLVRAVKAAYDLADHQAIVTSLTALIDLYDRTDRPGPAVDMLMDLADAQRVAGNPVGRAEALATIGHLMLVRGRAANAQKYLETADELLTAAAAGAVSPTVHARALEELGRALWRLGGTIRARRCFKRALVVLADHDPAATMRVQALLDTHADSPTLPDE